MCGGEKEVLRRSFEVGGVLESMSSLICTPNFYGTEENVENKIKNNRRERRERREQNKRTKKD